MPITTSATAAAATNPKRQILLFMVDLPAVQPALRWGGRGVVAEVKHRVQDTVTDAGNPAVLVRFHLLHRSLQTLLRSADARGPPPQARIATSDSRNLVRGRTVTPEASSVAARAGAALSRALSARLE